MSRILFAPFLLLVTAGPAAAQETNRDLPLQRRDLKNGLHVVVVENHAVPVATVAVAVRAGAAVQARTERGLAHLYEHLLFRAYGDSPSEFGGEAARLNATYNATTADEVVTYYLLLPSQHAAEAIRVLARLLSRPRFRPADLDQERSIVLDELERAGSDPERALVREVSRQLWGAAWHRRDVAGDSLSLKSLTPSQVMDHYARYYVPNNAALIVTGDVTSTAVFEAAERHFAEWAARDDPSADRRFAPAPTLGGSRAVIVARDLADVTMHIAMQGPGVREDRAATDAADALCEILNDASSRFQRQLVAEGLFQSVWASYVPHTERGPITFAGKTTVARAPQAFWALIAQIDSLGLLAGVNEEDLLIATRRRHVEAAIARETSATLAPDLAARWAASGIDAYVTYPDRMEGLSLDDLRQFAAEYLAGRPKVIGVMGPNDAMARIAETLRRAGGGDP